jgi:hypothetical protein
MARSRSRKPLGRDGRRSKGPRASNPRLTISFEEAAELLQMRPRTLRAHLKRTDARCLVPIGKRYRLDCKGFFRWCRNLGFESASF